MECCTFFKSISTLIIENNFYQIPTARWNLYSLSFRFVNVSYFSKEDLQDLGFWKIGMYIQLLNILVSNLKVERYIYPSRFDYRVMNLRYLIDVCSFVKLCKHDYLRFQTFLLINYKADQSNKFWQLHYRVCFSVHREISGNWINTMWFPM